MSTYNRPLMLAAGALLIAMTAAEGSSAAASITSRPNGFLSEAPLVPRVAESFSAELPHLRLDIALTRIENVVISGSGIISHGYPHATVMIASNAADVSMPDAADPALEFPTPSSGHTWNLADNEVYAASVNPLFVGVIENGCRGAPAMFDLALDSTIFESDDGVEFGEVHLTDTVFGAGRYNLEYTIRATDADGNASDITFRGHAESYCTGQLGNAIAIDPTKVSGSTATFRATAGATAADSITCRPGTSNWCSNGFQIACDTQGGGLSSEPDGGITCTYPSTESDGRTRILTLEPPVFSPSKLSFGQTATRQTAAWVSLTCNGNCDRFAQACDKHGGGLSSEPDGGTTCTLPDNTCSGCD